MRLAQCWETDDLAFVGAGLQPAARSDRRSIASSRRYMEAQKNDDRDAERRRRRSVYFRQSKLFVASVAGKLTECCARVDISTETVAIKDIEFDWGLDIEEVNALTRGKHFA